MDSASHCLVLLGGLHYLRVSSHIFVDTHRLFDVIAALLLPFEYYRFFIFYLKPCPCPIETVNLNLIAA